MPQGVFIRTEKMKRNMSKAHIGYKHTKATKLKMSKARIGRKITKATRLKISLGRIRRKKHLGYINSPATRKEISKALMGIKRTKATKYKMSKAKTGNKYRLGHKHTKATKLKMSKAHIGYKPTKATIDKIKQSWRDGSQENSRLNLFTYSRGSYRQELMYKIIKKYFKTSKYEYRVNTKKSYRKLDVAIPKLKLDFEYNGKIHLLRNTIRRDKIRTKELNKLGWRVIVFDKNNFSDIDTILKGIVNG